MSAGRVINDLSVYEPRAFDWDFAYVARVFAAKIRKKIGRIRLLGMPAPIRPVFR